MPLKTLNIEEVAILFDFMKRLILDVNPQQPNIQEVRESQLKTYSMPNVCPIPHNTLKNVTMYPLKHALQHLPHYFL